MTGTGKLVREFKRKAKQAGYVVSNVDSHSSGGGHLYAMVIHGEAQQRITLPSSPASLEQSIKHALDEMRRFRTAHEATTQRELRLHGAGGPQDGDAQAPCQSQGEEGDGHPQRRAARRRQSPARR